MREKHLRERERNTLERERERERHTLEKECLREGEHVK